jgi:hypothetical protein
MKRDFLGLQAVNELPESCVGLLVGYAGDEASIVFDLFVEFSTLITHGIFRIRAQKRPQRCQLRLPPGPPTWRDRFSSGWEAWSRKLRFDVARLQPFQTVAIFRRQQA